MYVKIHISGDSHVIAVCDEYLIGKTLKNDVTIKISEHFYKGEKKTEQEVINILKTASNINLIGKNAIQAGLKTGVITKENIKTIQGVPHAQAFAI
jgi:uncharacterized protein